MKNHVIPLHCNGAYQGNLLKGIDNKTFRTKLGYQWVMTSIRVCSLCPSVYPFSPPMWAAQLSELVLLLVPINNPAYLEHSDLEDCTLCLHMFSSQQHTVYKVKK
jgi:hypothetical protein